MNILIKGMDMPKTEEESKLLILTPDGITWLTQLGLGNQKFDTIEVREDVQPVKHGKWVIDNPEQVLMHCSNCKWRNLNWKWKYCPYCGAKMDGKDDV